MTSAPQVSDEGWPQPLVDLYQQRGAAFVRLAYLLTGDANVAEELVHDAFLASLGRWDRVREPGLYIRATETPPEPSSPYMAATTAEASSERRQG